MSESRTAGATSPDPADSATTAPAPGTADRNPGRRAADRIVGSSSATQHAAEQASAAARLSGPVGLVGASGSGKTHFARAIHAWSARAANPFVVVTAAAIPGANQTEEIFGPNGAFAQAGEGTILIRNIASLTDGVRAAVLRAVEEGAHDGAPVRARVLASARASVERAAKERGVPPPDAAEVTVFFESRIEEAKRVQRDVLAQPTDPNRPNADLAEAIRPALIRIGDRIAMLLVAREVERREDAVDQPQRGGDQ